MSFQRELDDAQAYLRNNKQTDRKKALETFLDLLTNDNVISLISEEKPFSWTVLLEDAQSCLKKECDRVAETISKKGPLKSRDKNLDLAIELLVLIIKTALNEGKDKIELSRLIKYIDGCLREKRMRICCDPFLRILKENILPNPDCLGYLDREDFHLIFDLLKSELSKRSNTEASNIIVFNCFSLLIKYAPLSGFPANFLREQFNFISKFCQSVTQNHSRTQQEDIVEIILNFCRHTAEDNRLSCITLGEEVFSTLLNLYEVSGHDSVLKVNVLEFCLLQVIMHHPHGVQQENSLALASNWHNWKNCIRKMYFLLTKEIFEYLNRCVKNTMFFIPQEKSTVILDSFVALFVEVCKQVFVETEFHVNYAMSDGLDISVQSQKRRKVDASLDSFISEIQETKSWIWIKLIGSLLEKYPELINRKQFFKLLHILHQLQLEIKDSNTINYIYETQAILIDIEPRLEKNGDELEMLNLWKLVGDSTLRAVGLNQNIKHTQHLLQKLINRNVINVASVIQTCISGVLIITEHHLNTLELVLDHLHFSQLELSKKEELFQVLLNSRNVKEYSCFLKKNFAEILISLTLRQCPELKKCNKEQVPGIYEPLSELYAKSNFEPKFLTGHNVQNREAVARTFNIDTAAVELLEYKLQIFVESSMTEPLDRILCVIGLLYNVLSSMVDYQILSQTQIGDSKIMRLINKLLENDIVLLLKKYETHRGNMLKELLHVATILDEFFSIRSCLTSTIKDSFPFGFLKGLVDLLQYFQNVARSKADSEHRVKRAIIQALSKYCLVSETPLPTKWQCCIMQVLTKPDYDFTNEIDYDLSMAFLQNIKLATPGFLPRDAVENVLTCLRELCMAKYRSYISAKDILDILSNLYQHLNGPDIDECQRTAVELLQPFFLRQSYYGPDISISILNAIEQLCKVDPECQYSTWDGKEVIKYVPKFLSSDFQRVRYKAIEILVSILKTCSGTTRLEIIHRLEELFNLIYEESLKVFEVEGDLTDQRRHDEILSRASSSLYTFVSIIVNCNSWTEESLFAIIKLEHSKKLFIISEGGLMKKVLSAIQTHFKNEDFMKQYVENILSRWIDMHYSINDFQFRMLGCSDKIELYVKYFDICLPLLLKKDRNDLFLAAKQLKMNEKRVLEHCCTKVFGRALSKNIKNLNDQFIQNNVEVSYLSQVLGSEFKEILAGKIDEVVLSLIGAITDKEAIEEKLGENVWFSSKGISYEDFKKGLTYIENLLCDEKSLLEFLSKGRMKKIQLIALELQGKIYISSPDQSLKCFHHYTVFIDLTSKSIKGGSPLFISCLRDTVYFLIHLVKNTLYNNQLSRAVLRYTLTYFKQILPQNAEDFEQFLIFIVNSLKQVAIENEHSSLLCIEILEFLIVTNEHSFRSVISKLDAFPQRSEFENIRNVHNSIKYSTKKLSLRDEIQSFLEYSDITTRHDSLIHLKIILSKEKDQIKKLYDELSEIRGFSEDCEQSILHKLISMLIKMSCYSNESISLEAIKCLGELGPADLNTIVLEPEKSVLDIKRTPFELLTGHVVSLLTQYIVDPDIKVMQTASTALYEILTFKEGKTIVDLQFDFGYGSIDKNFIIPYMDNSHKYTSQVTINYETLAAGVNLELWCPSEVVENNEWITSLVLALLNCFDYRCYLNKLTEVCKVKVKFCENILPLLVYLMISLEKNDVTKLLSEHINGFFSKHWGLTVSSCTDKHLIPVNKKAVKCMLDIINFIRQQPSISSKLEKLSLDYLPIAKAAAFCSAHFSALLYVELWCQEKIAVIDQQKPRDGTPFENGFTLLDYIYENVPEEVGITLQQILQSAYKSIGDLDALSGCGISLLLRPDQRVEYYKNVGQWRHVMNYYTMRPISSCDSNNSNLIHSFKMNRLYQLPLLCGNLTQEPQYECMWRLGQWNMNFKTKSNGINLNDYEKYKFHCLKALCENDKYSYEASKIQLSKCIVENLKHISLESSKNLYPIFSQLQSLVEMDDYLGAMNNGDFEAVLSKWTKQDLIVRKNDFQFVEPIAAQRMTLLREYIRKNPRVKKAYFDMVLNFSDYAEQECHIRVAENAIIDIRNIPNLERTIENELQFREAQLAWLNEDKLMAQQLLRKLCNINDINPRLKASCLKLQGVYMAERYSDRTSILKNFDESIDLYQKIQNSLTNEDRENLMDTYDKMATFADREYQQIMTHIKSDLFEKKLSNIKSCKEMAAAMHIQRKKTIDEKKAQVIHERQIRIDQAEIDTTLKEKDFVLELALQYYIKNLSTCDANNIKIFRVMALFLENRENKKLAQLLGHLVASIPSYKYITMLPQLIPHIATHQADTFSQHVNQIIEKCAIDHPHHTLPLLLALVNANKDREYTDSKEKSSSTNDRSVTAIAMIKQLRKRRELVGLIDQMLLTAEALIELAYYTGSSAQSNQRNAFDIPSKLKIRKIKDFGDVLVPTCTLPVSKTNTYNQIVGISKFSQTFKNVGGVNAPKRIECRCTKGKRHSQLVKGQDDLRQDAVMQQVFSIMTDLLSTSKQTKSLLIRTYKIVPLSMRSGILEWVANSMPIGDYLTGNRDAEYIGAHVEFRPQDKKPSYCRTVFKNCSDKSNEEKLVVFNKICQQIQPVFHKFFETHFRQPSVWYERRRAYVHSVATTSMCGYILGIGDRHVSNILIDKQTAEVIHIDFGIAFEQGKCLPTPETVPFRLTRDIVDGMGVSGIEGLFRKSCEKTMQVLRSNSQTILTILEVLLYDPLYFWTVSAAEAKKRQTDEDICKAETDESEDENKNVSAQRALLRLRGKLQGTEGGKPTSVEHQVGTLIQQAMDPANLCRLFNGWQPYL